MADSPLAAWLRGQDVAGDTPLERPANGAAAAPFRCGDDDEPPPRRRLLLLASLPWVVAVALGAVVLGAGDPTPPPEPAAGGAAVPEVDVPEAAPETEEVDRAALGQAGALLIRALLDPPLPIEAAAVTAVEPVGEAWVVTVLALVPGDHGAGVEHYAVALDDEASGPVALSGPWPLPPPTAEPAALAPVAVDDPALRERVAAALVAAGYAGPTGLELARDPSLPGVLLARVRAAAPRPGTWTVWLTDAPDPRVVGAH